jgi:transcriptional regulator with XRE-family HTH domain
MAMGRAGAEIVAERFGANLRRTRRREGLSQEQLAARASLHRTEIGRLEHAERVCRIDTLIRLAGAMAVPPGENRLGAGTGDLRHLRLRRWSAVGDGVAAGVIAMTTGRKGIETSQPAIARRQPGRQKARQSKRSSEAKEATSEVQPRLSIEGKRQAVQTPLKDEPRQHDTLRTPLVRAWAALS